MKKIREDENITFRTDNKLYREKIGSQILGVCESFGENSIKKSIPNFTNMNFEKCSAIHRHS